VKCGNLVISSIGLLLFSCSNEKSESGPDSQAIYEMENSVSQLSEIEIRSLLVGRQLEFPPYAIVLKDDGSFEKSMTARRLLSQSGLWNMNKNILCLKYFKSQPPITNPIYTECFIFLKYKNDIYLQIFKNGHHLTLENLQKVKVNSK
jgi:hypothetical protein